MVRIHVGQPLLKKPAGNPCMTPVPISKWRMGFYALIVLAITFVFWPFRFSYDSVCSQCGAIMQTTEWQLPYRHYTFFTCSSIRQTSLSSYLTSSHIVGTHSHHWLFAHGGGNGITCAQGDGDLIRAGVTSPEVVRLLDFSRQFGNQPECSNFLRYTLDRDISRTVVSLASSLPPAGFATRKEYQAWVTNQNFLIQDAVEASK